MGLFILPDISHSLMKDLYFENPWVFTVLTVTIWIIIATGIEVFLINEQWQGGVIKGLTGGLAYAITYMAIQKYAQ